MTDWHDEARALHKAGMTYRAISKVVGRSYSTVRWALSDHERAFTRDRIRRQRGATHLIGKPADWWRVT